MNPDAGFLPLACSAACPRFVGPGLREGRAGQGADGADHVVRHGRDRRGGILASRATGTHTTGGPGSSHEAAPGQVTARQRPS